MNVELETANNILTDYWNLKNAFDNLQDILFVALNLDLLDKFCDREEELEAILEEIGELEEKVKESTSIIETLLEQTTRKELKLS